MRKIKLELEIEIGELEEIGMALRQSWISGERGQRSYDLACGAGLGSSRIDFSASEGKRYAYAKASITPLAQAVWEILDADLDAAKVQP